MRKLIASGLLAGLLAPLFLAWPALGAGEEEAPQAPDRGLWLEKMQLVCGKVLQSQAEGTLKRSLPPDPRRTELEGELRANPASADLEAFARTLAGIAAWLELPPREDAEGRLRERYLAWARQGLARAVDPAPEGRLALKGDEQSLAECAHLVLAFWLAPKRLWEPLPEAVKGALCEAFLTNLVRPPENNWLFFAALPQLFVLEHGSPEQRGRVDRERILAAPRRFIGEFYKGDGWYGDGAVFALDGYNSFVVHPMLWELLTHLAALPEERRLFLGLEKGRAEKWLELEQPRLVRHAEQLERLVMPDGSYPQFGRSAQYRFGVFQNLSYACYLEGRGKEVFWPGNPGQVRGALTAVLKRQCTPENFDGEGWLRIGFNGDQPWLAEYYCTPGSPYLCALIFHVLGLPPEAPFWQDPEKPWTQKLLWGGEHVPSDKALR